MSPRRVLFVEGEPHLHAATKRMLRGQVDWELSFADSGEQALAQLVTTPVDAVVTGLHLPGMDGDVLLSHVQRLYPAVGRLILVGGTDDTDLVVAIGAVHSYLPRPREAAVLVRAVDRVVALRERDTDDRMRRILGDVDALPAAPSVHLRLVEVTSRPNSGLADVAAVLESDLALCADILRLANSAYFGLPRHVDSVERAVTLLGLDTVHALALSGKVFGAGTSPSRRLDVTALHRTGMLAAGYARAIAAAERWAPETVGRAFLAALLRDVGLLSLAADTAAYEQVVDVPETDPWARSQAELAAFGCTVPEASAYILGRWGIAEPVVEAIACQPAPPDDIGATPLAHVVGFAHCRTHADHVDVEEGSSRWNELRNHRWNAVCDTAVALSL